MPNWLRGGRKLKGLAGTSAYTVSLNLSVRVDFQGAAQLAASHYSYMKCAIAESRCPLAWVPFTHEPSAFPSILGAVLYKLCH